MTQDSVREKLKELGMFSLVLGLVLFVTYFIPEFLGFAFEGFEDPEILSKRNFYSASIYAALGLLLLKMFALFAVNRGKYGNSVGFNDIGQPPHLQFLRNVPLGQVFFLSIISFVTLGFINQFTAPQVSFTGVNFLAKQAFSPVENMVYSVLTVPGAENLPMALLAGMILIITALIATKQDWKLSNYLIVLGVTALIAGAAYGVGLHQLVYPGQDFNLTIVAVFWAIMMLLTILTGSFIPAWSMHFANNLFVSVQDLFSSDVAITVGIIALIGLVVAYAITYRKNFSIKNPLGLARKEDV